ncbi:GNAT family N-acetyltransferase [Halorubrum sp. JWXQ-INN 858]|uniref:GNAT family N-acetyltransferase n=1 Tax=Halorubrum sp. JWXQ-INN 858 TaxID=2690782 RepID=UPI00135AF1E3|nr:GNAT family N-acetyltransferase [Halorubrum sp. JWXQ-INN 858]MWV64409.1 GNAT family N-acetyltransferase [Halorubrum sp. JWXQ-INN 858]
MRVRPARPGDAEALRAAVSRAREATVFDDIGAPLLDVSAAGVREAASAADCCYLVEADGKPVGLAIAHPDADGAEAELLALWVHPAYTGDGIENRLLSRVAASLADRGVKQLRASVEHDLPSAREFYRAHGFSHRGTREGPDGTEVVVVAAVESLR